MDIIEINSSVPTIEVAVRLADEGLPICAIARSLKVPSESVREMLRDALADGVIVEYPREDWPPGLKRNSFGPALDNFVASEEDLRTACSRYFGTTHQQSIVLSVLLKRPEASKEQLHQAIERDRPRDKKKTSAKLVDVLICILRRKLKQFALLWYADEERAIIKTQWGKGYLIEAKDRIRAVRELNDFVKRTSNLIPLVEAEAA